jgi:hypothetical protein
LEAKEKEKEKHAGIGIEDIQRLAVEEIEMLNVV